MSAWKNDYKTELRRCTVKVSGAFPAWHT